MEWNTQARTKAVNEKYVPGGGDVKVGRPNLWHSLSSHIQIENRKLNWNAESRIRSLDNHHHVPGGGDKKIENRRLDWSVESRVGSTKNLKHKAGGGKVQVEVNSLTDAVSEVSCSDSQ